MEKVKNCVEKLMGKFLWASKSNGVLMSRGEIGWLLLKCVVMKNDLREIVEG